ncbi:MAG: Rrf2 family transcriptional regulator [Rhizomicrobium sp.]
MTSLKFATALHTLLLLAHMKADAPLRAMASRTLAGSIGANPVVVRRILAQLMAAGLVQTRSGSYGGAWLTRPASQIALSEIYTAVDEPAGPGTRQDCNHKCPVGRAAPKAIAALLGQMQQAAEAVLAEQTLADMLARLEDV